MPTCKQCHFAGEPSEFDAALTVYHDFQCPKCGTTAIDTKDVAGQGYSYGEHNTFIPSQDKTTG